MNKYMFSLAILAMITTTVTGMASVNKKCTNAVHKSKPGKIIHTESLTLKGRLIHEFIVLDKKSRKWEIMCDAKRGKVIEIERKSGKSKAFKKKAKVSEKKAKKTALKSHPGKVIKVEYEMVSNRKPIYEIAIRGKNKKITKVEVSAVSGKIVEVTFNK